MLASFSPGMALAIPLTDQNGLQARLSNLVIHSLWVLGHRPNFKFWASWGRYSTSYPLNPLHCCGDWGWNCTDVQSSGRGSPCCQLELLKTKMAPISLKFFYCAPLQYRADCSNGTPFRSEGKSEPSYLQACQGLAPTTALPSYLCSRHNTRHYLQRPFQLYLEALALISSRLALHFMSLLKCPLLRKACSDQLEISTPLLPGTSYPFILYISFTTF